MRGSVKTILIGIFVIIAAAIVVSMLLFIHPTVGDNAKTLRIRFNDVDKVDVGTRVTFAGHPVGEVTSIREIPDLQVSRTPYKGEIYAYEVEAKVDSAVDIFNSDEILVRTSGLLGEKNIEINPQPIRPGETLVKVDQDVLYAIPSGSVETTLKKIESALDNVESLVNTIKEKKIIENLGRITSNLAEISDSFNQPEKLRTAVDNVVELSDRALKSWDIVEDTIDEFKEIGKEALNSWSKVDQTLDQLHQASGDVTQFTQTANTMIDQISQGKGTIGHLLIGNDLYLQLKSILHKGDTVMNDISSYGLLFNTNKRWQRVEAERRRLVQRLSNPYQFASYFNHEMEQISTSIWNVSSLLGQNQDPWSLMEDPNFTLRFSELLKTVENMEETLKLYNEQLNANPCTP